MSATTTPTSGGELPPLEYPYRTFEGARRRVLVATDENDVWLVYDVPVGKQHLVAWLVARMDGRGEKLDEGAALACDYSEQQIRFHSGERGRQPSADPLPKPVEVPVAQARKHAARARRIVAKAQPKPAAVAA